MKKAPLWEILIEREYFEDRKTASSWIMAGKVIVNEQRADHAGEVVPVMASIRVKGLDKKYVGKGGLKLEGALNDLGIDVLDKVALDTGASTGGFTDCLLQHGASKVYAIDVGYGQLVGKLRVDPRVINMEKTNIGDVSPAQLQPKPMLATIDLSYLSLKKAIPIILPLMEEQGELLCLVKPLFEVSNSDVRRKGRIEDPTLYREVLHDLVHFTNEIGLTIKGITHSHITGNNGTREFFIYISLEKTSIDKVDYSDSIQRSIENALSN